MMVLVVSGRGTKGSRTRESGKAVELAGFRA